MQYIYIAFPVQQLHNITYILRILLLSGLSYLSLNDNTFTICRTGTLFIPLSLHSFFQTFISLHLPTHRILPRIFFIYFIHSVRPGYVVLHVFTSKMSLSLFYLVPIIIKTKPFFIFSNTKN